MKKIEEFYVIGTAVRTQNVPGKGEIDIPQLWDKFMQEDIISQIPNKDGNAVYCVYTDYESDHTQPYTCLIGCKVSSLDTIPEGMRGITVQAGEYKQFTVKGNLSDNIVFDAWMDIWQSDIKRSYADDFEVYEEGMDYDNAQVSIFIGTKD